RWFAASARTPTSKAASSPGPPHRSSAYHSVTCAAWATTDATVKSRPGTATVQSLVTAGSRRLRHAWAAVRTSSPRMNATLGQQHGQAGPPEIAVHDDRIPASLYRNPGSGDRPQREQAGVRGTSCLSTQHHRPERQQRAG